jgi:hypothetical protein
MEVEVEAVALLHSGLHDAVAALCLQAHSGAGVVVVCVAVIATLAAIHAAVAAQREAVAVVVSAAAARDQRRADRNDDGEHYASLPAHVSARMSQGSLTAQVV